MSRLFCSMIVHWLSSVESLLVCTQLVITLIEEAYANNALPDCYLMKPFQQARKARKKNNNKNKKNKKINE